MTNWHEAVNFTFQVFTVILDIFYTCISCVEWIKKLPIHRLTTPWVHIVCMFTSIRRRSNVHLFTEPTCICTRLKSISWGVFSIVPACWSRDKAADHMLDSIGHRCAPNRSQGERDGMSSRCGCVFLNFDVNKICHEKMLCSCNSHGLNNRAHTYYMPMYALFFFFFGLGINVCRSRDFSAAWKGNPLVNNRKKNCFDDKDYTYSVSVAEAVVTVIICDFFQFEQIYGLRFNVFNNQSVLII